MALRGSIAEAALADVVQMLALGRRTGRLSVARDGELGTVWFVDGDVAHAVLAHRRDPLGAALVRCGALDDADLRAALVEQTVERDVPLGVLLVRRGCVAADVLTAHVTVQTAEAAYELLGWTRGTFSFDADVAPLASALRVRLDVGSLLLESARRADDGVLLATEVPGPSSVFERVVPAPADAPGGSADADNEARDAAERVAALLDGQRDVQAVADAAGLSTYHVTRAVYALVRAGRVRRVIAPAAAPTGRHAAARADEHFNLGVAFSCAGLLDDALRELRRALEVRPTDGGALAHLGAVALRAGRLEEAAAALGAAAARPGAAGATLHALGVARHALGQLDLADEAYAGAARRGLGDEPRHLTARAALALDRGDWAAAGSLLDRARVGWPRPPAVWYHYALVAAVASGDAAQARVLAREGVEAHPRAAVLAANAAALAATAGPASAAAEACAGAMAALAARPDLAPTQRLLGHLRYAAGEFDRAREAYAAATRLAPDASATAWARLGSLALRAGDVDAARQAWTRACSLQADHPTARANLDALGRSGAAAPPAP